MLGQWLVAAVDHSLVGESRLAVLYALDVLQVLPNLGPPPVKEATLNACSCLTGLGLGQTDGISFAASKLLDMWDVSRQKVSRTPTPLRSLNGEIQSSSESDSHCPSRTALHRPGCGRLRESAGTHGPSPSTPPLVLRHAPRQSSELLSQGLKRRRLQTTALEPVKSTCPLPRARIACGSDEEPPEELKVQETLKALEILRQLLVQRKAPPPCVVTRSGQHQVVDTDAALEESPGLRVSSSILERPRSLRPLAAEQACSEDDWMEPTWELGELSDKQVYHVIQVLP